MGFSMGASLAFFRPSANLRARTSSFVFSASTEARNFASTASACLRSRSAVSPRSIEGGGLGGGTWERTTPISRSMVSLAWQQGQGTSNVSSGFFAMERLYAKNARVGIAEPREDAGARREKQIQSRRVGGLPALRKSQKSTGPLACASRFFLPS